MQVMKHLLTAAIFVCHFATLAVAQNATELHRRIQKAIEGREYSAAVSELQDLRRADRKGFDLNDYDYLLGRISEKTGDFAAAMGNYQSVLNRNSALTEYALFHLAQIAHTTGNLMLERIYLQQLIAFSPESLLASAAQSRLARNAFVSKNYVEAIRLLNNQRPIDVMNGNNPQKPADSGLKRENLALLGQAYLQNVQQNETREVFTRLINSLPNPAQPDDFALNAVKGLDLLDGGAENLGKKAPHLVELENLRRAFIYQFNRDFADARLHYQAIIENYPTGANAAEAIYQIGRGYAQQSEFVEAIKWFERLQEQFPNSPISRDALNQAASAYSRVGKQKEAITRYQRFIEKYPDDEKLDRAYLNIVDILRDQGEDQDALKWTAKTREAFKGKLPEAIAIFAEARIFISRAEWQNALTDLEKLRSFSDLGGTRVPGGTSTAEITFLKAYSLEQLNRFKDAIDAYLSIPDGRNEYYSWRANERIKALSGDEEAKSFITQRIGQLSAGSAKDPESRRKTLQEILRLTDLPELREKTLADLRKIYRVLPNYQKIPAFKFIEPDKKELSKSGSETTPENIHKTISDTLLFLGLFDEAAPELDADPQPEPRSKDLAYTMAVLYKRGDMADRAVAFIEPLWKNMPADYQIELIPQNQLELLYPTPYADSLLKFAPERGVDPRFVLSIIRQESRYRPDVKSYAAARGLMQFISTTSDKIAGELGRSNFRSYELYSPPTAILFGSQYLADLFKQFPNQPDAVATSYNGGDDSMKRWLGRSNSNVPDRYVPEVVYSQSKDYVQKVMANYRIYQMIYDQDLRVR